ncbi:MAG: TolC family protein [Gemmatimonadota bacterium]
MPVAATFLLGLALLQAAPPPQDSIPRVTLAEALARAAELDPNYVAASRQVADAEWSRRAAITTFIVPSVSAQISGTRFTEEQFNIGTGQPSAQIVDARIQGRLNLFRGLGKVRELERARAALEGAQAGELEARYVAALFTESDFFDVLAQRELLRVARERTERVEEQFGVARARVLTGAAVQTDSLQLLLQLQAAQVELIRQEARLKVARFQLGRRVGATGPVDAVDLPLLTDRDLPLSQDQAVQEAIETSPSILAARAEERAAAASVKLQKGSYLPTLDLVGQYSAFDQNFFPSAIVRGSLGLVLSLPLWDDGARELAVSRSTSAERVATAAREDLERALRRDVVEAYEAYDASRAALDLAESSVLVAQENLRVQQERYRAGATTILDLLAANGSLSEAEAELVQAQFTTRLALTGLEAILGRRLFDAVVPEGS